MEQRDGVERELVQRAQNGDSKAMEQVLAQLAPRLHRFSSRLCESHAEDALQETLISVATNLPSYRGESALTSWAFSLVRTACGRLTRGRKNAAHAPLSEVGDVQSGGADPEEQALSQERLAAFNCAIQDIAGELREAVLLRDVEGLDAKEAALAAGVSVSAFKSRLHRGRSALSSAVEKRLHTGATRGSCPDVLLALSRQEEDELSGDECERLHAHLGECDKCDHLCKRLKEALGACREPLASHRSEDLQLQLRAAYEAWKEAGALDD